MVSPVLAREARRDNPRTAFLHTVLAVAVFVLTAGFALAACPQEARAADPDSDAYYAEVKYYDTIQMRYIVRHGLDDWWTTTGDIPIGGFLDGSGNQLIDQAYCVDATVAFHGSDETSTSYPSGVTTDTTTAGYVVASPLAVSDSVRANLPSLYWLAVNGFRGERGGVNNLADIRSAYADLEAHYGTPIDETIAIMATKAAVWNFTDPTFALLSTSLDPDPANATATQKARYELMVALMKRLVSDARTDGLSLATTTLDVVFDNSGADFTSAGDGGYFYGPVTAHVQTSNGTGTPEKIYLTASGMYASDFLFVQGTPPAVALLPQEAMYGSQTTAPFVHDGDPFYLKIPATVVGSALVNLDQPTMSFAYLALHGFARSADVTYSGTPAIMAWQGPAGSSPSGEQDWQHVQAFIGFVNNMQASLYGEGSLLLRGDDANASISLQKKVIVSDGASNAGSFVFTLEVKDNSLGQWVPVPLIPQSASPGAYNISGASGLAAISPSGVFSLAENDVVSITGLPLGEYRISEQESEGGYTTVYQLDSFTVEEGSSADLELGMVNTSHTVAFTNTIIPQTPEIPEKPIIPGGGGRIPATGDHNTPVMLLVAALAVGGIGVLVYSQRKARSSQVR